MNGISSAIKIIVIIAILFGIRRSNGNIVMEKLKVTVYYEALCPYSATFIIHQLRPACRNIGKFLSLDLVPYGNVETAVVKGKTIYKCQHKEIECKWNKIQGCGLQKTKDQDAIKYVGCIQEEIKKIVGNVHNFTEITKKCAGAVKLDATEILNCADGDEGYNIFSKLGEKTDALRPRLYGTPTIVFNDSYNMALTEEAQDHFHSTACRLLQHVPVNCGNWMPKLRPAMSWMYNIFFSSVKIQL